MRLREHVSRPFRAGGGICDQFQTQAVGLGFVISPDWGSGCKIGGQSQPRPLAGASLFRPIGVQLNGTQTDPRALNALNPNTHTGRKNHFQSHTYRSSLAIPCVSSSFRTYT